MNAAAPHRVVVTGCGAVSAVGATAGAFWEALLAGRSGIARLPRFVAARLPVTVGGEVAAVPVGRADRDVVLANRAIDEALDVAGLGRSALGFIWATGLDTYQEGDRGPVFRPAGSCFAALAHPFGEPRRMIAAACAAGTQAIGEAYWQVRAGHVAACVAGGSSCMLSPFYIIGFAALQALAADDGDDPSSTCRPFDRRRRGFAVSDGAGALVVESLDGARRRGAPILAEIVGFGMSQDRFDLNRPPEDGSGAERCLRRAVEDAGLTPGDVGAVNAHATGTRAGDLAEAAAIRRFFGDVWTEKPVSSLKGAIGHAMAAAGALEAVAAVATCRTGVVPPTVNLGDPDDGCELCHVIGRPRPDDDVRTVLSASFGMGGQNAAVLFRRLA
jgi:3-oxoacyl-[acyl-carrier-protein] synthase II